MRERTRPRPALMGRKTRLREESAEELRARRERLA